MLTSIEEDVSLCLLDNCHNSVEQGATEYKHFKTIVPPSKSLLL